jgi:hypothetical protein
MGAGFGWRFIYQVKRKGAASPFLFIGEYSLPGHLRYGLRGRGKQ